MLLHRFTVTKERGCQRLPIVGASPVVPLCIGVFLTVQEGVAGESASELIGSAKAQPQPLVRVRSQRTEYKVWPINPGTPGPNRHGEGLIRQRHRFV